MYIQREFLIKVISVVTVALMLLPSVHATDVVKMLKPILAFDKRAKHKDEVIISALDITIPEYGPYTYEAVNVNMTTSRALISMKTGEHINVFIAPSNEAWAENTIEIKVPVRQGLLSYRLLLVNKQDLPKYKNVKTFEDIKKLSAGLMADWSTTTLYSDLGMKVVNSHNFEGLFLMLNKQRFDYIPRAIYEVFDEYESRKDSLENVVIEPTLALYIPMATYAYVSPSEPRLAARIEAGLKKLVDSGKMKEILEKYYAEDIAKTNLKDRRIIEIENANFDDEMLKKYKDLWLSY